MSNIEQGDFDLIDISPILDKLKEIIYRLQPVKNNQIDLLTLKKTEEDLENLRPQFQFAKISAQEDSNWEQVSKLSQALDQCDQTLDSVRAAKIKQTIVGVNPANLSEMQKILKEIKTASKTQQTTEYVIHLLSFVRKLFV